MAKPEKSVVAANWSLFTVLTVLAAVIVTAYFVYPHP